MLTHEFFWNESLKGPADMNNLFTICAVLFPPQPYLVCIKGKNNIQWDCVSKPFALMNIGMLWMPLQ